MDLCQWREIPPLNKDEISRQVKEAAYQVIERRGAAYYAIGLAAKRICKSIFRNENSILTVSGLLSGQYGISNVCMSLPCIINRKGRVGVLPVNVSPGEKEALHKSAQVLGSIQKELGCPGDITFTTVFNLIKTLYAGANYILHRGFFKLPGHQNHH
ncbi:MAG: hypothetical protein H0Z40_07300 [Desulfotomaculum sp.]|nr:hypothetical protein [Desulfotomaculum sp.]